MKKRDKMKKILCVSLAVVWLTIGTSGCTPASRDSTEENVSAAAEQEVIYQTKTQNYTKTETVYAMLDSAGAVQDISVTDWIHTDTAQVYLQDVTDLENVWNVKSDTEPYFKNGALFWNMPTTDLYYRGTSTKPLPISISLRYFIDDTEMTAQEAAGKSGNLRIEIEMTNSLYTTQKLDGKEVKIYNPMVCVGGMILPETKFRGIQVDGGVAIGDGAKEIIAVAGLPGMNETLGLEKSAEEDAGFREHFTVRAYVTDFELSNMYFAAMPLSAVSSIAIPTGTQDLQLSLNQLKEIERALQSMDASSVLSMLTENPESIGNLATLLHDTITLYEENRVLLELLSKYMTEENIAALQKLSAENSQMSQLIGLLADPAVQRFLQVMPSASAELNDILPMMSALAEDMKDPQVQAAIAALPETAAKLAELQKELESNRDLVSGLTTLLNQNSIEKLTALLQTANAADFTEKLKQYGVLTQDSDALLARVSAMLEYGEQYTIYTLASQGVQSSVTFIFKTPVVKMQTASETPHTQTEEKNWFQRLFHS